MGQAVAALERHGGMGRRYALAAAARHRDLFDAAMDKAWDALHGGIHYGFAPDDSICDADKYFWVQAESLATAALLGARTGDQRYWDWYDRIWAYSWEHFVDHNTAPGTASSARPTKSSPTRKARPARSITTPWAPATKC
jgi:mannose/cellobiose epimerase-like protein (N-acyl-D-glucosamine 2-epimerase family)